MGDIPGLIKGAHTGSGLGIDFLRHIERARVMLHMVDLMPHDGQCAENYRIIREELEQYSPRLIKRPEIVVANKIDLTDSDKSLEEFRQEINKDVVAVSAVTGQGIPQLHEIIWRTLCEHA